MMQIKRKYIARLVNIIENEIDNIFSFDDSNIDFMLEREEIILRHADLIFKEIEKLEEQIEGDKE